MSSVRSVSRLGPNRMHTLIGVVTPTSEPARRKSASAPLITPRSAPSVRLKCVYHWYFVRLVRIACWGLGISPPSVDRGGAHRTDRAVSPLVPAIVLFLLACTQPS